MTLVDIGARYDTDKGTRHRYWQVYDVLLGRHRHTAQRVLEIGTFRGESLRVWLDYFTHALVVGIDIEPTGLRSGDRLEQFIGDAYTHPVVERVTAAGPFDVIIDDGPHTLESMRFAAAHWSRALTMNGTLVIEDIPDYGWVRALTAELPDDLKPHSFAIDRRNVPGTTFDDILFVVDRAA